MFIEEDTIQIVTIHQLQPANLDYLNRVRQATSLSQISSDPQVEVTNFVFDKTAEKNMVKSLLCSNTTDWIQDWITLCKNAEKINKTPSES